MKPGIISLYLLSTIALCNVSLSPSVKAQISSDGTLSTTVTSDDGINFLIENGDRFRDDVNLFHSFRDFSIPNLGEAYFNNATDIVNIFSRVTGGNISDIQGLIRANGTANLFLINPAGIIFGENASLDIGGSFFATTADSIVFGERLEFSATQPQEAPLLTVNITPGLQYGANPLAIDVSGANLAVNSGQSISLLGGDVAISNSEISAPGGQINLGGLAATGTIQIEELTTIFPENTALSNVNLTDTTIIDVTSTNNGNITINAADLTMSGASEILAGLTSGGSDNNAVSGNIIINATGNINLSEKSLIANDLEIDAIGNSGNIELNTNSLSITEGSRIQTVTNSSGASGDITIYANTGIVVDGFTDDGLFSGVLSRSATENAGVGGNLTVNSPQNTLTLSNRGFIGAVTNSNSDGGNIETNLNNLVIESGGQIVTATTNLGNAGDITINATESVNISGESRDFINNPFLDLAVFDLDALEWITTPNPNVEASDTIPYVSVERTPSQIINGTTILGTAEEGVDYYSFSVTQGGSRAIVDIDGGWLDTEDGTDIDTHIFLFNRGTGELLASNSESDVFDLGSQEAVIFPGFTLDTVIDTTLEESGVYLLAVSAFSSEATNNQLVEGAIVQVGNTYTLNLSAENQGTEGVSLPVDTFNPANYNPNVEATSGVFSESSGIGAGGNLTLNTPELIINDGGRISTDNSDVGIGGDIALNADVINISDLALVSSTTRGSGDAGNILINTERLSNDNGGDIRSSTLSTANAGNIQITAEESVLVTSNNVEAISSIESTVEGEATGNGGSIEIDTPLLRILNVGQIIALTFGIGNGGQIDIQANSIELIGNISPFSSLIGAQPEFGGTGDGGSINIVTDSLRLLDGGQIIATTRLSGNGGNIKIQASDFIEVMGISDGFSSGILVSPKLGSTGEGGNLTIETGLLRIADGGTITASTAGAGNAGNLSIQATEVEVSGVAVDLAGAITGLTVSVDEGGTGNGGNLNLDAESLRVTNGGQVIAGNFGDGNAGDLILEVEEIDVSGMSDDGEFVSRISAFSETATSAGSIDITADNITVSDRAQISVSNTGTGDAGNLTVNADQIFLDNQGSLQANVAAGNQGNINLTSGFLLLRHNSNITTNAGNQANGGNITIETVNLVALENSDITANAVRGQGGDIIITAQGLFLSLDSEITASSEFGVDGVVTINNPEADENAALLELPEDTTDPSQQIAEGCAWVKTNSFTVTGRGGTVENPTNNLGNDQMWSDLRDLSDNQSSVTNQQSSVSQPVVIEANAWIVNEQGNVELVAVLKTENTLPITSNCAG